jgi:anti-sigma-K factor RskA
VSAMTSGHEPFTELAAGYALDALDPADEDEFLRHLPGCDDCQQAVAEFTEVAAELAGSYSDSAPPGPDPQLGQRIMAAVARESAPEPGWDREAASRQHRPAGDQSTSVGDLDRQRRKRRAVLVALASAAAAVLVAVGVTWGTRPGSGERLAPPTAGCVSAGSCHQVVLASAAAPAGVARVIVAGRTVWLVPGRLRPDDTARQIYVLWQLSAGKAPRAVGTFDVRGDRRRPLLVGSLTTAYGATKAFAVTLERGRTAPAVPSHPVATGLVSS